MANDISAVSNPNKDVLTPRANPINFCGTM